MELQKQVIVMVINLSHLAIACHDPFKTLFPLTKVDIAMNKNSLISCLLYYTDQIIHKHTNKLIPRCKRKPTHTHLCK